MPKILRPKSPKTLKQWGKVAKMPQDAGRETGFLSIGPSSENKGITNSETRGLKRLLCSKLLEEEMTYRMEQNSDSCA